MLFTIYGHNIPIAKRTLKKDWSKLIVFKVSQLHVALNSLVAKPFHEPTLNHRITM